MRVEAGASGATAGASSALHRPGGPQTCLEWAREGERYCRDEQYSKGIECFSNAITAGTDDMATLSAIYSQMGNAFFSTRCYSRALEFHTHDLNITRLMKDDLGEAKAYGNLGNTYKILGNYAQAISCTEQQLRLGRQLGDKRVEARSLYNLGSIYHLKGKQLGKQMKEHSSDISFVSFNSTGSFNSYVDDLNKAVQYYKETLALSEETGDTLSCGRTCGNLGIAYYLLRDYHTAIHYHYKRLEIARQFGDKGAMRRAYSNLGNAHVFLPAMEKAVEFYRLAHQLALEMRDELAEAQSCFSLAQAATLLEDYHTAVDYHHRHLVLARKLCDRAGEARAYSSIAMDYKNIGDLPKAVYYLYRNRRIAREMNDSVLTEQAERSLRELVRDAGDGLIDSSGEVCVDSSADPHPLSVRLSGSLRSLNDDSDCGLNRHPAYRSEGELSGFEVERTGAGADSDKPCSAPMSQEDFFEMLTRAQSKRLDDQRCDPAILADLTNRGLRQTDTLMIGPNASVDSSAGSSRRLSLMGRLRSSVFKPSFTSTPLSKSTSWARQSISSFGRRRTTSHSGSLHSRPGSPVEEREREEAGRDRQVHFRVPRLPAKPVPPSASGDSPRRHSMAVGEVQVQQRNKDGPDSLIELIMSAQGRRMDEQRAILPGLQGAAGEAAGRQLMEKMASEQSGSELEGGRGEVDERLYELVLRSQKERIDEQRMELGGRKHGDKDEHRAITLPEDDISQLVLRMQAGRLEEQRAHLVKPQQTS